MFYDFAVTVTAGTLESAPKEQIMKLTKGVIHRVELVFRNGTDFRVGLRIFIGGHQLYPTNPDSDFRDEGRAIVFDDYYVLDTEPYELKAKVYSPTASYDHTIYIRIGLLEEEIVAPVGGLSSMLKKFFKLVGIGG